MPLPFNKIAILGGGTMGRGLAQLVLQHGYGVVITNRSAASSSQTQVVITAGLQEAVLRGKLAAETRDQALTRLTCTRDLGALADATLVIENLPEDRGLKRTVLADIGPRLDPEAILATNTSSLSVGDLALASGIPERVIGLHFFNPPTKMKLLEIIVAETTSESTYIQARRFGESLGKSCIRVKDSPGFATSRLSVAVGLEALRMLEEGVASAADIDTAMEVGYRWPMGPLKLGDWVGLDVRLAVAEELHQRLGSETFLPPEILRRLVREGKMGRKSGEGVHPWPDN